MEKEEIKEITKKLIAIGLTIAEINDELAELHTEVVKEEFVTVTDGWRGSLKLKECWVLNNPPYGVWEKEENVEIVARVKGAGRSYKIISNNKTVDEVYYLKFRPFSPENPPPVDWPIRVEAQGNKIRYFKGYNRSTIEFWSGGMTSKTSGPFGCAFVGKCEFLNIEPVE